MNAKCTFCNHQMSANTLRLVLASFDAHVVNEHGKPRPGLRLQRLPRKQCKPAN